MDSSEYENLDRVERSHWFYEGKRRVVRTWIGRLRPLAAGDTLLDFGAGTGLFAADDWLQHGEICACHTALRTQSSPAHGGAGDWLPVFGRVIQLR